MIASVDEFIRLRTSDVPEEYQRAAHDEAPLEVWRDVIAHHPEMRFWVAHNKTVPLEILELLTVDENADVRDMVARKRKASSELLAVLARDPDERVRGAVASNAKTSDDILRALVDDS